MSLNKYKRGKVLDIVKLRDWYRTPTGHVVRRLIQNALADMWPNITGKRILVIGYGIPYVKLWLKEAQVFCALPAKMGAMRWPDHAPNRCALTWESELPFNDETFDAIFMVHCLEFCQHEHEVFDECSRVLKDDGRLLCLIPNRGGAWSHREISPLALGKPYSLGQLEKSLQESSFIRTQSEFALFTPPTNRQWIHNYSETFEKIGRKFRAPMGGVILMEGKKDIHAGVVVRSQENFSKRFILRPARLGTNFIKP